MPNNKIIALMEKRNKVTKKQQVFLDYMIQNIERIADITADDISVNSGISKATIFRTLHSWNYDSLVAFKLDISNYFVSIKNPNYWQVQQMLSSRDKESLFSSSLEKATQAIKSLLNEEFESSFLHAVDLLEKATEIGVIGARSSNLVAQYFEAVMLPVPKKVSVLTSGEHFALDRISKLPPASTLLVIARWPYTKFTIKAAEYAKELGHSIILLTNYNNNEMSLMPSETLITSRSADRYSIVPFIVVTEALSNELCSRFANQTSKSIEQINMALQKYNLLEW